MFYKFKYRRKLFWKSYMVVGHEWDKAQDKMVLIFKDGGLLEIKDWKNCELKLGADWFAEKKREMEASAGQKIPMKVGRDN